MAAESSAAKGAAIGGAAGSVVPGVGNAVGAAIGALAGFAKDLLHQDNLFIEYRNDVMAILRQNGFPDKEWDVLFEKYQLSHKHIKKRKTSDYGPEFKRLRNFVAEFLNTRASGLGELFLLKDQEIAQQYIQKDPSRSYKGAPDEALKWVLNYAKQNQMNLTGIFSAATNVFSGINVSQASVNTSTGGIVVPQAQQGSGIFSQITNLAATALPKLISGTKIEPTVINNLSQTGVPAQTLASGGGFTVTGNVSVGGGVTKTGNQGGNGDPSGGGWVVLVGIILVIGFIFRRALGFK